MKTNRGVFQNKFEGLGIDRMRKWPPTNYSFVFVLISLTSLVLHSNSFKLQVLARLVRPINTKTKK